MLQGDVAKAKLLHKLIISNEGIINRKVQKCELLLLWLVSQDFELDNPKKFNSFSYVQRPACIFLLVTSVKLSFFLKKMLKGNVLQSFFGLLNYRNPFKSLVTCTSVISQRIVPISGKDIHRTKLFLCCFRFGAASAVSLLLIWLLNLNS